MSSYILRVIAALSLSLLTACSTSNLSLFRTTPLSLGPITEWHTKLAAGSGKIEIQFKLEPHSSADLTFGDIAQGNFYATKVNLNDYNCTTGHEAAATYRNQNAEYYTSYFNKPAPWNAFSTLIIEWDENKKFTFDLNGEKIQVNPDTKFKYFTITSSRHPIDIQKIFYTR